MSDQDAFLNAIKATPDDDTTRLVFADWLDDHEDPKGAYVRAWMDLREIVRNPHDKALRLKYAEKLRTLPKLDAYELDGFQPAFPGISAIAAHPPQRADLIEKQCKLVDLPLDASEGFNLQKSIHKLLKSYGREWFNRSAGLHAHDTFFTPTIMDYDTDEGQPIVIYQNGFAKSIKGEPRFLERLAECEVMEPVQMLEIANPNRYPAIEHTEKSLGELLCTAPIVRQAQFIDTDNNTISHNDMARFFIGNHAPKLRALNVDWDNAELAHYAAARAGLQISINNTPVNPAPNPIPPLLEASYQEALRAHGNAHANVKPSAIQPYNPQKSQQP